MGKESRFKHRRQKDPALFLYDFDGVFSSLAEHTHNRVVEITKRILEEKLNGSITPKAAQEEALTEYLGFWQKAFSGDESSYWDRSEQYREYDPAFAIHYKDLLRDYNDMLDTLQQHMDAGDNIAIVTNNEYPEIARAVLEFYSNEVEDAEFLTDVPIFYGAIFDEGRDVKELTEANGFFRITKAEAVKEGGGKNAHILKASELFGIELDQAIFIDDSKPNIDNAYQLDFVDDACIYADAGSNFHEKIQKKSQELSGEKEAEYSGSELSGEEEEVDEQPQFSLNFPSADQLAFSQAFQSGISGQNSVFSVGTRTGYTEHNYFSTYLIPEAEKEKAYEVILSDGSKKEQSFTDSAGTKRKVRTFEAELTPKRVTLGVDKPTTSKVEKLQQETPGAGKGIF